MRISIVPHCFCHPLAHITRYFRLAGVDGNLIYLRPIRHLRVPPLAGVNGNIWRFWLLSLLWTVASLSPNPNTEFRIPNTESRIIGVLFHLGEPVEQNQRTTLTTARPSLEAWGVRVVALLTAVMGVVNLFSAIIPAVHSRMVIIRDIFPMEVLHGTRLAAALAGFALLLLAGSLWRRKRTAWLLTVLILVGSIAVNLVKGLDYEEASLDALLIVFLLLLRSNYHADSDRPSVRQGLVVLAWAFGFTLAYGTLGLNLLDRHFKIHFGFWGALQQTLVMFTTFNNPSLLPVTGFGRYFVFSIYSHEN